MPAPCTPLAWKHIYQKPENSIMLPREDKMVQLGKGNASCEVVEQQQPLVLPACSCIQVSIPRQSKRDVTCA